MFENCLEKSEFEYFTDKEEPKKNNNNNRWWCPHCGKDFSNKYNCSHHIKTQHLEEPKKCPHCERTFRSPNLLENHIKVHEGTNPHCEICGKGFSDIQNLNNHQVVHTGERKYSCERCPSKFSYFTHLKRHKRDVHHEEEVLRCDKCGKAFSHEFNLSSHMLVHGAGESFQCDKCNRTFHLQAHLKLHKKIHEPKNHKCPKCPRSFTHVVQLLRHQTAHTGPKKFKCESCDIEFVRKETLGRHFRKKHTDIHYPKRNKSTLPLSCLICNRRYAGEKSLKRHLKVFHEMSTTDIEIFSGQSDAVSNSDSTVSVNDTPKGKRRSKGTKKRVTVKQNEQKKRTKKNSGTKNSARKVDPRDKRRVTSTRASNGNKETVFTVGIKKDSVTDSNSNKRNRRKTSSKGNTGTIVDRSDLTQVIGTAVVSVDEKPVVHADVTGVDGDNKVGARVVTITADFHRAFDQYSDEELFSETEGTSPGQMQSEECKRILNSEYSSRDNMSVARDEAKTQNEESFGSTHLHTTTRTDMNDSQQPPNGQTGGIPSANHSVLRTLLSSPPESRSRFDGSMIRNKVNVGNNNRGVEQTAVTTVSSDTNLRGNVLRQLLTQKESTNARESNTAAMSHVARPIRDGKDSGDGSDIVTCRVNECSKCRLKFQNQSLLQGHACIADSDKPNYQCNYCGDVFPSQSNLEAHECQESLHICEFCHTCFSSAKAMHSHTCRRKIHNCVKCKRKFTSAKELRQHKCSPEKYECGECSKVFHQISKLSSHKCSPAKFECERCSKVFGEMSKLNSHTCPRAKRDPVPVLSDATNKADIPANSDVTINRCSDELRCTSCDITFTSREDMVVHRCSKGTDVYAHECHRCHVRFDAKEHLEMHICVSIANGDDHPNAVVRNYSHANPYFDVFLPSNEGNQCMQIGKYESECC